MKELKYISVWQLIKKLLKQGLFKLNYKVLVVDQNGNASNIIIDSTCQDNELKQTYIWTCCDFCEETNTK